MGSKTKKPDVVLWKEPPVAGGERGGGVEASEENFLESANSWTKPDGPSAFGGFYSPSLSLVMVVGLCSAVITTAAALSPSSASASFWPHSLWVLPMNDSNYWLLKKKKIYKPHKNWFLFVFCFLYLRGKFIDLRLHKTLEITVGGYPKPTSESFIRPTRGL